MMLVAGVEKVKATKLVGIELLGMLPLGNDVEASSAPVGLPS